MTLTQEDILLSLIQGTSGSAWAEDKAGWKKNDVTDGACSWDGVECDAVDKETVTGINLSNLDLAGTLPTLLGQLGTLNSLILSQNIVHGSIPKEIANLPHLEIIDISENEISGTIPDFASPLLKKLLLKNNRLTGTLPYDLGQRHERLITFDVMHNYITGPIPESIKVLENLDTFSISENDFTGTIPSSISESKVLRYLYMDNNHLMGTIPTSLARPESPLQEIWLQVNSLSGTIPAAIADLPDLFNFYIDGNKFTGTVPKELCRKELNEDFFKEIPDEATERNYCDSVACPVGNIAAYGVYPCTTCEKRFFNPYLGREGTCIDMNTNDILKEFYEATNPNKQWDEDWDLNETNHCGYFGITCDNHKNVIGINLKYNKLHGSLPDSIGFLRFLEHFDVSDNDITGFLPSDLRWAPLEKLDVSGNKLRGIVPPSLCRQQGVNGNGETGEFSCERIACPMGFYSDTGNGVTPGTKGPQCKPCVYGGVYLGTKVCSVANAMLPIQNKHTSSNKNTTEAEEGAALFLLVVIAAVGVIGGVYGLQRVRRYFVNRRMLVPTVPSAADYL